MNQLSFLDHQERNEARIVWRLEVDGASRGNPGLAGAGIHIIRANVTFMKQGYFLGHKTNNQAEYEALILGICLVKSLMMSTDSLEISSDSELLVYQIMGKYAVKNDGLKLLHARAKELLYGIHVTIQHIVRARNAIADQLANEGIDKRITIPEELRIRCALVK